MLFRSDMTMGVRPEHLVADDAGPIGVKVMMQEQLGANTLIHGVLDGTDSEMVVSLPGTQTVAEGAVVRFSAPSEALHFFDQNSGQRIG